MRPGTQSHHFLHLGFRVEVYGLYFFRFVTGRIIGIILSNRSRDDGDGKSSTQSATRSNQHSNVRFSLTAPRLMRYILHYP